MSRTRLRGEKWRVTNLRCIVNSWHVLVLTLGYKSDVNLICLYTYGLECSVSNSEIHHNLSKIAKFNSLSINDAVLNTFYLPDLYMIQEIR